MAESLKSKWTKSGKKAALAVSDHTLKVARPLFWHIGAHLNGVLQGASAFILRFDDKCVGVTADHVVDAFQEAKKADSRMICQFGESPLDLEAAVIARSSRLDIATFNIADEHAKALGNPWFDVRGVWPPPAVAPGDTLTLTGFLDNGRVKEAPQRYMMSAWGAHGLADDVSDRDLITIYDPLRDLQADPSIAKPNLGMNLSGCSGGPVVLIKVVNGLLRWFPVGLIYKGPDGKAEGEFANFDRIHVRRLHFIQPDGAISEPDIGWLP